MPALRGTTRVNHCLTKDQKQSLSPELKPQTFHPNSSVNHFTSMFSLVLIYYSILFQDGNTLTLTGCFFVC